MLTNASPGERPPLEAKQSGLQRVLETFWAVVGLIIVAAVAAGILRSLENGYFNGGGLSFFWIFFLLTIVALLLLKAKRSMRRQEDPTISYARKHLLSGETIERETHLHGIVYLPAVILFLLSLLLFAVVFSGGDATKDAMPVPVIFLSAGVLMTIAGFVRRKTSEFVVTNKRVMVKTGWLNRRSTEILLRQVEGITVDQGIVGRMLDYGTIVVEGTGSDRTRYKGIAGPLKFRMAVQEQIELNIPQPNVPAPQQPLPPQNDPYTALLKLNELKEKGILTDEEFKNEKQKILGS
jgi:membrane protein YdbS with pleckstrin-like domain